MGENRSVVTKRGDRARGGGETETPYSKNTFGSGSERIRTDLSQLTDGPAGTSERLETDTE